jgi:hypothetical protein
VSRKRTREENTKQKKGLLGMVDVVEMASDDDEKVLSDLIEMSQMPGGRRFYLSDKISKYDNRYSSPGKARKDSFQNLDDAMPESGTGEPKSLQRKQPPGLTVNGQTIRERNASKSNKGKQKAPSSFHDQDSGQLALSPADIPENVSLGALINARRKALLA